ncbi:MAG: PEP-CTERM/exosortase system-associated acyltransferase [Methylococcaceae bacterium]|jgi:N-acyl amino acid synthase of PEP-CTERM/exosortase system
MFENNLAQHFQKYFSVVSADTDELKKAVYKLRYDVYCAELQYEKDAPIDCEKDSFDDYAKHVLITHKDTGIYAGCVRLVYPPHDYQKAPLPFEINCLPLLGTVDMSFIEHELRSQIGELSRLSVYSFFRRRAGEQANPYGFNFAKSPLSEIDDEERRYYPLIAVALYMASASIAIQLGIKYVLVMMEPRLAKHLARFGICFIQLSKAMDYHGERALFYIDNPTLIANFKPELEQFYQLIDSQLKD